jgi:hypothetical protein
MHFHPSLVDAAAIAKEFGNLHQIQYMHLSSFFSSLQLSQEETQLKARELLSLA